LGDGCTWSQIQEIVAVTKFSGLWHNVFSRSDSDGRIYILIWRADQLATATGRNGRDEVGGAHA